ncbi:MAG: hypothetical protein K2J30_02665, partial [Clostridia bacterium]|nr:hypothetical protein [Clostridia bacterium]
MRSWTDVWNGLKSVFVDFGDRWIMVFEFVFLFMLIYFVLRTLYENNAKKLIGFYVGLILCTGFIALLSNNLGAETYYIFLMLLSLFFLLLFSVEIKRSIWNVSKRVKITAADAANKSAVGARAEIYIAS